MKTVSPLRYPGGKSSLAGLLASIRQLNRLGDWSIAEPFAGGAGASLVLLRLEQAEEIWINDADPAIHDFWAALMGETESFVERLSSIEVTMSEWRRQRDVYRDSCSSPIDRGFAAFFLNRCNRSGIIVNGGPIGGVEQSGEWKLDARFNTTELLQRCRRLRTYRDRVHVSGLDGIDFILSLDRSETFFFIDPPYYEKGRMLYLNVAGPEYHQALASTLKAMSDAAWVLTYDDCPEVRAAYEGWATVRPFSLRYAAAKRRHGREVLIAPRWMQLPDDQDSDAIVW